MNLAFATDTDGATLLLDGKPVEGLERFTLDVSAEGVKATITLEASVAGTTSHLVSSRVVRDFVALVESFHASAEPEYPGLAWALEDIKKALA